MSHRQGRQGRLPFRNVDAPSFRRGGVETGTFRGLARGSSVRLEQTFPRLIDRNLPFHQSKNKIHIEHRHSRKSLYSLLRYNWFHVFLRVKTRYSLIILLTFWTSLILVFAGLYIAIDKANPHVDCGLGNEGDGTTISFYTAFSFSLETCTTVGYGLPGNSNAFFNNCPGIQVFIYFQMTISMMFNAFLFSFFFTRMARSESRAVQVVFSQKVVVRLTERGTIVWQVRVYDCEIGHGIVEAHVRMYALLKHKDSEGHPQLVQLRIVSPDDELGSVLFLNIPTVVTHEMDYYSPLYPSYKEFAKRKFRASSGGLLLREVDSVTCNREEIVCPVCGETYGDYGRLRKHIRYNQMVEKKDDYPLEGSHQELDLDNDDGENAVPRQVQRPTLEQVMEKLALQELIVIVEGIDPLTSGTFQALQSYMPEDIEWGARFVPCLTSTKELNTTFVDMEKFHKMERASARKSYHRIDRSEIDFLSEVDVDNSDDGQQKEEGGNEQKEEVVMDNDIFAKNGGSTSSEEEEDKKHEDAVAKDLSKKEGEDEKQDDSAVDVDIVTHSERSTMKHAGENV